MEKVWFRLKVVKPGAVTPYPAINQLLGMDERLSLNDAYLLAPKSARSLSALLFLLEQQGLAYSQSLGEQTRDSIYLSVQHLQQIDLLHRDVVEVHCGCNLETLNHFLFEHGLELGLENLISPKQLVGEAILAGTSFGLALRQMNIQDRLLALEFVKPGGGIVKLGASVRGAAAGPELHQFIWGIKQTNAILIKAAFRIDPIPPVRLHLAWSFECRGLLWEQFHRLKKFSIDWERLDCMIPRDLDEKSFIIGQISGLPEEIEAFKKACPSFSVAKEGKALREFLAYFKQKNAQFQPIDRTPSSDLNKTDYEWHFGLTGGGWNIFINALPEWQNPVDSMPLWKERILACLDPK